ncbi:MAG TPA: SDR family NAD(P)-dependent oxidoreductase [Acidimicrobiales bacterium]|jgi:2-deoxy-D-gluconate 3-dehydrogenase|nr:SDR family NAD(P)-dependent oxidoreductase [Acidimicrobiales bacterium]
MSFTIDPALFGLEDAVALVTGAGQNIARGCALKLARAGCHVAVVDMNTETGPRTVADIEALGRRAVFIEADVCDVGGVQHMVDETISRLGSLEVACNVVGNPGHAVKPLLDTTLDEWNRTLHRNLGSAFLGTKAEAIAMIERRIPGRIINFASSSGVVGAPTVADYGAANAGVIHLTKSAAMELARYGIRVNCVVPGTHAREGQELSEFAQLAAKAPPLGRLGNADETAGVALFLASDLSSYVTGHAVFSDGGVVHTTARPPVGLGMTAQAVAHVDWTVA